MQNFVFVLDASKQPLSPCHPSVARKLLQGDKVIFAAELEHRGQAIKDALAKRRATGMPVEVGTGGRTKSGALWARTKQAYPKAHWIDAACVGKSGQVVGLDSQQQPLKIKAVGRQNRQMCRMDKYGFQRTSSKQSRVVKGTGFQTGDIVKAVVLSGKYAGTHVGAIAVRATGSFRVGKADGISWKYCKRLHALDGYAYAS